MLQTARQTVKAALRGVKSIELTPRSDYWKYVSTPRDIEERSWNATGVQMRKAIDTVGVYVPKKQGVSICAVL